MKKDWIFMLTILGLIIVAFIFLYNLNGAVTSRVAYSDNSTSNSLLTISVIGAGLAVLIIIALVAVLTRSKEE